MALLSNNSCECHVEMVPHSVILFAASPPLPHLKPVLGSLTYTTYGQGIHALGFYCCCSSMAVYRSRPVVDQDPDHDTDVTSTFS